MYVRAKIKIGDYLFHFVFFFLSIFNTSLENGQFYYYFFKVTIYRCMYLTFTLSIGIKPSGVAAHKSF